MSVTGNIVANFAGKTWSGLLGLLVTPIYLQFLGIEAFGLIGVWNSLVAILSILDLGLSGTLGREVARLSGQGGEEAAGEMRDLTATFALVFAAVGLISGAAVLAAAGPIAERWIRVEQLSPATATRAVQLMGLVFAVQWPMGLLNGAIMSLQRQGIANLLNTVFGTLRAAGAILILWLVSPTIGAFFAWQALLTALQLLANLVVLDRVLPPAGRRGAFRADLLRKNARLAAGITGAHAMGIVMTQADRFVLTRMLTLREFGYYSLGTTIAAALYPLIGPVFSACSPRLCQLVGQGVRDAEARFYHRSSQLMSTVVLPPAIVLAAFSAEVIWVWTGNRAAAETAGTILPFLAAGTAVHGLMFMPWALQVAHGWTRTTVVASATTAALVVPLVYLAARVFGPTGAAGAWAASMAMFALAVLPVVHRRLLPGHLRAWLLKDVGLLLGTSATIAVAGRLLLPMDLGRFELLAYIVAVGATTAALAALAAPELRAWLRSQRWPRAAVEPARE